MDIVIRIVEHNSGMVEYLPIVKDYFDVEMYRGEFKETPGEAMDACLMAIKRLEDYQE